MRLTDKYHMNKHNIKIQNYETEEFVAVISDFQLRLHFDQMPPNATNL